MAFGVSLSSVKRWAAAGVNLDDPAAVEVHVGTNKHAPAEFAAPAADASQKSSRKSKAAADPEQDALKGRLREASVKYQEGRAEKMALDVSALRGEMVPLAELSAVKERGKWVSPQYRH